MKLQVHTTMSFEEKAKKSTHLTIEDYELWEWAKYKSRVKQINVSEYVFQLIKKEKERIE